MAHVPLNGKQPLQVGSQPRVIDRGHLDRLSEKPQPYVRPETDPHSGGRIGRGMGVCVFASASDVLTDEFVEVAERLGELLGQQGYVLVYGGSRCGLMGIVARAARRCGGHVVGIIPRLLDERGFTNREADEIIVTNDMYDRKAIIHERSSAYVVLPGGVGTLEEVFGILTCKRLGFHSKPLVFVNTSGFYDGVFQMICSLVRSGFASQSYWDMFQVAREPQGVFPFLRSSFAQAPDRPTTLLSPREPQPGNGQSLRPADNQLAQAP